MAIPAAGAGSPAITYEWYRTFLQTLLDNNAYTWFAPLIAFGEMAVGLGLLLGVLTGFAAFFGALMNMSFLLAGSASVNPVLFTLAIGLILAWKVAGYYGVDRYLLPMLGTPVASGRDQGQGDDPGRGRRLTTAIRRVPSPPEGNLAPGPSTARGLSIHPVAGPPSAATRRSSSGHPRRPGRPRNRLPRGRGGRSGADARAGDRWDRARRR